MDELTLDQVRDDAFWIVLIIVAGLLVLRFARAPIRRILQRVFEGQTQPGSTEKLTATDVQKRVDTVETLAMSTIRFVVLILVVILVLGVLNLGPVIAGLGLLARGGRLRRAGLRARLPRRTSSSSSRTSSTSVT